MRWTILLLVNKLKAEVPLAEMFGYATDLRSMSQGRANYSMEFAKYTAAPRNVADEVIEKIKILNRGLKNGKRKI